MSILPSVPRPAISSDLRYQPFRERMSNPVTQDFCAFYIMDASGVTAYMPISITTLPPASLASTLGIYTECLCSKPARELKPGFIAYTWNFEGSAILYSIAETLSSTHGEISGPFGSLMLKLSNRLALVLQQAGGDDSWLTDTSIIRICFQPVTIAHVKDVVGIMPCQDKKKLHLNLSVQQYMNASPLPLGLYVFRPAPTCSPAGLYAMLLES